MNIRITDKDLQKLVDLINELQGFKDVKYNTVGAYKVHSSYGGVKLVKVFNNGGGVIDISQDGYGTKKELYIFLKGFLSGLESH
jgi:hypothetical protein